MVSNPSEFRTLLQEIFEASPLRVGGTTFDAAVTDEAIEEFIASMVRSYMNEGGPTACEKIVGAFFVGLIEKQAKENANEAA
jgi:hypothetical protein